MNRIIDVYRHDPSIDKQGRYEKYEIIETSGMRIMDVLDYVYQNLDSSIAYYDHGRCDHGICARCAVKVNGTNCLACQTLLPENGEVTIEPTNKDNVLKDVVTKPKKKP